MTARRGRCTRQRCAPALPKPRLAVGDAAEPLRGCPRLPRLCADAAVAPRLQRDENVAPGASGLGAFAGAARAAAPSRYGPDSGAAPLRSEGGSPERFFSRGNEKLYEAFQQLHTMAQDFDKPFDSPAILVVGHQTDGKSGALALRRRSAAGAG